jgi:glucosamine kinase
MAEGQAREGRMAEPLFIGVDGGATKCVARLRDAGGRLLGEGAGGPANARARAPAYAAIMDACRQAIAQAARGRTRPHRAAWPRRVAQQPT